MTHYRIERCVSKRIERIERCVAISIPGTLR